MPKFIHPLAAMALCLMTAACLEDDPNHCANRGGGEACAASGLGEHCSVCKEANWGCRSLPDPDPSCRVEDGSDAEASEDTDSTEVDEETEGTQLGCDPSDRDQLCWPVGAEVTR